MMENKETKQWKAMVALSTGEANYYPEVTFDIPADYYEELQSAVKDGESIHNCSCVNKMEQLAEEAVDPKDYFDLEEPDRDSYEDEEDYQAALEEYNDQLDSARSDLYFWFTQLDDPNAEDIFKNALIGRAYPGLVYEPEDEDDTPHYDEYEFETTDSWSNIESHYTVEIGHEPDGTISDITIETAEALEWGGFRTDSWGYIYPDYDYLESAIGEEFAQADEEDEEEEPEEPEQEEVHTIKPVNFPQPLAAELKTAVEIKAAMPSSDSEKIRDLDMAIAQRDYAKVKELLGAGVDPNASSDFAMCPLTTLILCWTAPDPIWNGICKIMLEHGAAPDYRIPYKSLAQVIEENGSEELKKYYSLIISNN